MIEYDQWKPMSVPGMHYAICGDTNEVYIGRHSTATDTIVLLCKIPRRDLEAMLLDTWRGL